MASWRRAVDVLKKLKFRVSENGANHDYDPADDQSDMLQSYDAKTAAEEFHFEDRFDQEWHQPALKRLDLLDCLGTPNQAIPSFLPSLHEAAKEGRISDIRQILNISPKSMLELTPTSETPLHLAVRHGHIEVVSFLVQWCAETTSYTHVINNKDCGGDTVLHLATARKQLQILKLLLEDIPANGGWVDVNARNHGGFTALDILDVLPEGGETDMEIEKILRRAGASRGRDIVQQKLDMSNHDIFIETRKQCHEPSLLQGSSSFESLKSTALIIATLVATVTFQVGLRPPYGLYQSNESGSTFQTEKQDGVINHLFLLFDSIAFFTSMTLITIFVHEFPFKPWLQILVLSTIGTYIFGIMANSPHEVLMLILTGSSILLIAFLKWLALHKMLLNYSNWMCTRIRIIKKRWSYMGASSTPLLPLDNVC